MMLRRNPLVVVTLLLSSLMVLADDKPAPNLPKISEASRMALIRGLNAEMVFVRRPFPMGDKGVMIKAGVVSPDDVQLEQLVASYGPALKTGDRARITNIRFKGDKLIVFEINGGPKKKAKWYEHIQVSGMGGTTTPTDPTADPTSNPNPRGSFVVLAFDKYVPELSIDQVKQMLRPVFDFNAISAAQAYMDTLPPKVKDAIKNHQVLVGMNRDMVTYALGRPPKKYRDRDGAIDYEEWIYGEPPKEVQFVRFVGDEVVRLEIMTVSGQKVIRTEREVSPQPTVAKQQVEPVELTNNPGKAPTLRRAGEPVPAAEPLPKGGVDDPTPKGAPPAIPGNGPPE